MEKQKAIEIPASERYDSPYSGEQETAILQHAEKLKDQTAASDGDTVQVYDVDGNPHKVAKSELLKKSTLALPDLSDISKFVAVNAKGDAIGLMTKEQVAQVLGELIPLATPEQDGLLSRRGFMVLRGQNTAPEDANNAENGIFYISRRTTNYPVENTTGVLVSFSPDSYIKGQICFSIWPETVYIRSKGDLWGQWLKIQ